MDDTDAMALRRRLGRSLAVLFSAGSLTALLTLLFQYDMLPWP